MHAATYFGDADAQYRLGQLYLDDNELGENPLQSARWLSLAARKGHAAAQATLGDLLFNGSEGLEPQPEEGLMWLIVAQRRVAGTPDEGWINDLVNGAISVATPEQRATRAADGRFARARGSAVSSSSSQSSSPPLGGRSIAILETGSCSHHQPTSERKHRLRPARGRSACPSRASPYARPHPAAGPRPAANRGCGRCGCRRRRSQPNVLKS